MRIGDTWEGPRDGYREIIGFEWDPEDEAWYRSVGAPEPEAGRRIVWADGSGRVRRSWIREWNAWAAKADRLVVGCGALAPWEAE